jgi:membrane protein YdbS with pleckstrin-like domain
MSMSNDAGRAAERGFGDDWLVRRPGARERRWFRLHGLIRGLFWLIPFAVVALLWVFWFEVSFGDRVPLGILLMGFLVLLAHIFWGLAYPQNWLVCIGQREVMIQRGILHSTRVFVPYDRVQQIDFISTPIMNSLDLTELELHTAAGGARIYALDPADADLIGRRVRRDQPDVPEIPQ